MLKIAHRGASSQAPENTLAAFRKAIELGADGVELDVRRCKSGELVVIHDETVDRTTSGKGRVIDMTLKELQQLKIAGSETIPTLDQVLDLLGNKITCFIECKQSEDVEPAATLVERYVKRGRNAKKLWVITFKHEALAATLKQYPALYGGASFERVTPESVQQAKSIRARAILPNYEELTQAQVHEAHALGLKIIPWTVNNPADITRIEMLKVDGIISDYPQRLAI
jgi:glycerophosphoryl diester phosphodiesterase